MINFDALRRDVGNDPRGFRLRRAELFRGEYEENMNAAMKQIEREIEQRRSTPSAPYTGPKLVVNGCIDRVADCNGTYKPIGNRNGRKCFSKVDGSRGAVYYDGSRWKVCQEGAGDTESGWNYSQTEGAETAGAPAGFPPLGSWQASRGVSSESPIDYSNVTLSVTEGTEADGDGSADGSEAPVETRRFDGVLVSHMRLTIQGQEGSKPSWAQLHAFGLAGPPQLPHWFEDATESSNLPARAAVGEASALSNADHEGAAGASSDEGALAALPPAPPPSGPSTPPPVPFGFTFTPPADGPLFTFNGVAPTDSASFSLPGSGSGSTQPVSAGAPGTVFEFKGAPPAHEEWPKRQLELLLRARQFEESTKASVRGCDHFHFECT